MNKLQLLYENGLHFSVESYYEIGFTFYFGDRFNGTADFKSFPEFDQGVEWLWGVAQKRHPEAKCFKNIY